MLRLKLAAEAHWRRVELIDLSIGLCGLNKAEEVVIGDLLREGVCG